jgi:hypothetical protein
MSNPEENTPENYQGHPLTDNLSTARSIRQQGEIDMRKFTNIENPDILFLLYAKLRSKHSSTWATIYDEFLNMKVGVGGLGMRFAIRGESVRKGIASNVDQEIKRPGLLSRIFTPGGREKEKEYQERMKELDLE